MKRRDTLYICQQKRERERERDNSMSRMAINVMIHNSNTIHIDALIVHRNKNAKETKSVNGKYVHCWHRLFFV